MPTKRKYIKKREYTLEWFHQMQAENRRKLEEIMRTDNYQRILGEKYYGDNWRATLYETHPDRTDAIKENAKNARLRQNGEDIPYAKTWNNQPVLQYDMNNHFIAEWSTAVQYCLEHGKNKSAAQTIVNACRGKALTAYGYKWKFKNEE